MGGSTSAQYLGNSLWFVGDIPCLLDRWSLSERNVHIVPISDGFDMH